MPRAMAAFDNTSIAVTAAPLPAQIRLPTTSGSFDHPWSPDLHTLLASRSIIKEYAGLFIYWLVSVKQQIWD